MIYGMMNYENVILVRCHSNSNYIGIDHRLVYIHIRKFETFENEGENMNYIAIITKPDGSQQPAVIQGVENKEGAKVVVWAFMRNDHDNIKNSVKVEVFNDNEIIFAIV